jgi:hypothetical protein
MCDNQETPDGQVGHDSVASESECRHGRWTEAEIFSVLLAISNASTATWVIATVILVTLFFLRNRRRLGGTPHGS